MGRARTSWFFGGVWEATGASRPSTVPMRQLRSAARAVGFGRGIGRKLNMALIFGLARWGMPKAKLPKKSLGKYTDDFDLFDVLKLNGQIRTENAYFLGDLSVNDLLALEKRLHHQWPTVQSVIDVWRAQLAPLNAANIKRRKRVRAKLKPARLTPASYLGV